MKLEFLKKKKVFVKGGFHTNPDVAWEIVVFTAFGIILASFVFGFYLFGQTDQDFTVPDSGGDSGGQTITKDRMDKALGYFSERQSKSTSILNSPSPVVDPSL